MPLGRHESPVHVDDTDVGEQQDIAFSQIPGRHRLMLLDGVAKVS